VNSSPGGPVLGIEEQVQGTRGQSEMGLPVQALAQQGGRAVVEFPPGVDVEGAGDGFRDDEPGSGATTSRFDAAERDRRFAEMAERHAQFMFRVAHGLLRCVQDAEDAVQEALLKLYRGDAWLRMKDEKAFLARTVWRVGLDVVARRPKATEPLDGQAGREFAAANKSAEQSMADGDERALLHRLIDALPEELRQPLVLSAIEEMTSREVAEAMGIPEGTVRTRVMRARAELKRRFEAMRKTKTTTDSRG
jgi:RNA polymerase sigma-70 factor (ECF subfamily)